MTEITGTEFLYLLENHQVVILVGQTGSGKTTRKSSIVVRNDRIPEI